MRWIFLNCQSWHHLTEAAFTTDYVKLWSAQQMSFRYLPFSLQLPYYLSEFPAFAFSIDKRIVWGIVFYKRISNYFWNLFESRHTIFYMMIFAPSEGSDHPAQVHNLRRIWVIRLNKTGCLATNRVSQEVTLISLRVSTGWSQSLLGGHVIL